MMEQMDNQNKRSATLLPLLLALFLVGGMLIGNLLSRISTLDRFQVYPKTNKINSVIDYIAQEYVDSINKEQLVEMTIPDILKHLDPHSVYIPADELQQFNEPLEGNFSGIGVQFNMQDDTVAIINTVPNGPSEKLGIKAGDRIIRVNDSLVAGVKMQSDNIVKMLKGKRGTKVKVTIIRRGVGEPLDFVITRDKIPLTSIDVSYMIANDIGMIKISEFSRTTYDEFIEAVKSLQAQGMKKLILDLRSNGGGYMDAATKIADEFLDEGKLIVYTEGRAQPRHNVYAAPKGICINTEILVLIDELSASASEIFAGAIQDNDRGLIVGRRSFGKGLVQQQTVFSDGSALRLTIARYYTPTGRCIQKPYNNGLEEYYYDIQNRYDRGEFVVADSIKFADSLKFVTPGGNIVYGGGGIMPDLFVPFDTIGVTPYLNQVRNRGLIYRYAFFYTDNNRAVLSQYTNPREISAYLDKQDLLTKFVNYAELHGVKKNVEDIILSEKIIMTQLKAYIARNIIDNSGYYPIIQEIDQTLQKGIEILASEK
jgi:carboxyl-terminal processing protease